MTELGHYGRVTITTPALTLRKRIRRMFHRSKPTVVHFGYEDDDGFTEVARWEA